MALRRWLTLLWWWIAGWLQRGAAFFARQAAQQAGRAQLTLPPAGEQPETPSPSARPTTPGTPPAHWLEHVRSAGPPADWLARVQATAPELAEAARRPPDVTHTPFSDVRQRARLAGYQAAPRRQPPQIRFPGWRNWPPRSAPAAPPLAATDAPPRPGTPPAAPATRWLPPRPGAAARPPAPPLPGPEPAPARAVPQVAVSKPAEQPAPRWPSPARPAANDHALDWPAPAGPTSEPEPAPPRAASPPDAPRPGSTGPAAPPPARPLPEAVVPDEMATSRPGQPFPGWPPPGRPLPAGSLPTWPSLAGPTAGPDAAPLSPAADRWPELPPAPEPRLLPPASGLHEQRRRRRIDAEQRGEFPRGTSHLSD